jgi:hypothetical protein
MPSPHCRAVDAVGLDGFSGRIATRYDKTARNFLAGTIWPLQSFGSIEDRL